METLSVRACIRYGWQTFKRRPWFLVGVTLLLAVINMIIPSPPEEGAISLMLGIGVVSVLLSLFLQLAGTAFALRAHDSVTTASLKDLWRPELYLRYLGTMLLSMLVIGIAFAIPVGLAFLLYPVIGYASLVALVLVIPGIILALALSQAGYLVIDQGQGPVAALKESARITKGNRGKLLLLGIAVALLVIVGLICLLVGVLIALPVASIAMAHAYRVLSGTEAQPVVVVETPAEPVQVA